MRAKLRSEHAEPIDTKSSTDIQLPMRATP
jgi:hypothetical protein